jgi:hypothetical protein
VDALPLVLTMRHSRAAERIADGGVGGAASGARGGVSEWVTVLGLPVQEQDSGDVHGFDFLASFQVAARSCGARHKMMDSFDSALLVIAAADLPAFFAQLDPRAALRAERGQVERGAAEVW